MPSLQGEKASRAQILKKAAEYISSMRRKSSIQANDIADLKKQNENIENQSTSDLFEEGDLGLEQLRSISVFPSLQFDNWSGHGTATMETTENKVPPPEEVTRMERRVPRTARITGFIRGAQRK